ncbi:UNVERIFIED_CONTAM: hypothetical protein GTU68_040902, partial [Idotea baltica]|nr:hypothetical protein [Idotea baltica]
RVYPFFLEAALVTVQLSVLTCILGLACGALGASMRLSRLAPLRWIAATYVSLFRGTPALIQVFILYFGGPQVGINLDAFAAGTIALGVNIGAYMTETIRGAILSVDKGQYEGARTLGLSRGQTLRRIVIPQAVRAVIPPMGNNMIALLKDSALVSVIGVAELTLTAQQAISRTYRPFEFYLAAAFCYYIINLALEAGLRRLERRIAASR